MPASASSSLPRSTLTGNAVGANAGTPENGNHPQTLDRIVAVVNKGIILQSQLASNIALVRGQMKNKGIDVPSIAAVQGQVLEHMIMVHIQLQRAGQDGIKVNDKDVNAAIGRIAKQNHVSKQTFFKAAHEQGISKATLRREIRDQIVIAQLRRKEVTRRIDVTDQDINLYLANNAKKNNEEYHLSYILIAVPDDATKKQRAKAKHKAEHILDELHHGAKFAQLAIRDSDGSQALQGGDLGWRKGGELPTMFANVVPTLKVGETSKVIKAVNGYNIVRLDDRRSNTPQHKVTETHLLHIVLKSSAIRDAAETATLAHNLYQKLEDGADFAKLAEKYSDDPQTRNEGGDAGWQPSAVYSEPLQKHIEVMKKGETSKPFKLSDGWHIMRLLGRRTVNMTNKIRRQRARVAIMKQREQTKYESWLRNLRAQAYVSIKLKPGWITKAEVQAAKAQS